MKKVSTAAARRIGKIEGQRLTVGLDLGDRSSWYCVLDAAGEVLLERKLATTLKAMKEVFGGMPRSRIALETGMHSPWVSRRLSELEQEVIVAHARNVRLIGESRRKDDRFDARTRARLARIDPDLLGPVQHRSRKAQADLTVIRARAGLVRTRTSLINTARGLTKSYGERLRGCSPRKVNRELAEGLSLELQSALQPLLNEIESLSERIREYHERVQQIAQESYSYEHLHPFSENLRVELVLSSSNASPVGARAGRAEERGHNRGGGRTAGGGAGQVESTRGDRLSLKYQSPAVERATPFCLVWPEFRRLDSMKTPTLFAGMGSANKYPWADPQPANANSWYWLIVSTPSAITLRSRLRASPTIVVTMA